MLIALINLIISSIFALFCGINAFHNGFINPPIAYNSDIKNINEHEYMRFNLLSPMLWIIIINIICIIILLIKKSKISEKTMRIISIVASIWNLITIFICLGFTLYN